MTRDLVNFYFKGEEKQVIGVKKNLATSNDS